MQFQSDILGVPVIRPVVLETTALGAALLAGLAVGLYPNKEEAARMVKPDLTFTPGHERIPPGTGDVRLAPRRGARQGLGGTVRFVAARDAVCNSAWLAGRVKGNRFVRLSLRTRIAAMSSFHSARISGHIRFFAPSARACQSRCSVQDGFVTASGFRGQGFGYKDNSSPRRGKTARCFAPGRKMAAKNGLSSRCSSATMSPFIVKGGCSFHEKTAFSGSGPRAAGAAHDAGPCRSHRDRRRCRDCRARHS